MSLKTPHEAIIRNVARSRLKPAGFQQKGRSRLWYLDRGWHAIVAEFQPRSGRCGSFMNFAVTWLWQPRGHWAFDIFDRLGEFVEYDNDDKAFERDITELTQLALDRSDRMKTALATPKTALAYLSDRPQSDWGPYHCGILAGLVGNQELAQVHFDKIINAEAVPRWAMQRKIRAKKLRAMLAEGTFETQVVADIRKSRAMLNLPEHSLALPAG